MVGATIWFTGLSGAGKTTIANEVAKRIREKKISVVVFDGNIVRKTLSADLGYSKEDRDKHITRVSQACELVTQNNVLNIACVISPTRQIRKNAREIIKFFIEVYIKCPINICEERDVQGHYEKVRNGEIKEFVGISIPYEEPENPDIILETDKEDIDTSATKLMDFLNKKGLLE